MSNPTNKWVKIFGLYSIGRNPHDFDQWSGGRIRRTDGCRLSLVEIRMSCRDT